MNISLNVSFCHIKLCPFLATTKSNFTIVTFCPTSFVAAWEISRICWNVNFFVIVWYTSDVIKNRLILSNVCFEVSNKHSAHQGSCWLSSKYNIVKTQQKSEMCASLSTSVFLDEVSIMSKFGSDLFLLSKVPGP